ncbi:MAG: hypothetical protein OQK09_06460 [Colwellia sp.]|nr:hypothetical protein [Colwellia sp.]MCW8863857.1 hypothetical protein [Colwellia sp.]MCW9081139.1 hypothetical protein [Colwellia sp.]
MTDTVEQQMNEIRRLTLSAAQLTSEDKITSCQQALAQRHQRLIALDQAMQSSKPEEQHSALVEHYAELVAWMLKTDQAAIEQLNEKKAVILQKSVKQSKTKFALKQYQANYR